MSKKNRPTLELLCPLCQVLFDIRTRELTGLEICIYCGTPLVFDPTAY